MDFSRRLATILYTLMALYSTTVSGLVVGTARQSVGVTCASYARRQCRSGGRPLRAAANEEGVQKTSGGFVNPYTAFRQWQADFIDKTAKSKPQYESAVEGLMKEPGMTEERATRLAKMAVMDPILYSMTRKREAAEINQTPMDYSKISGFFPMDWIMSGDFGWGYNKKRRRELAAKKDAEAARQKQQGGQ